MNNVWKVGTTWVDPEVMRKNGIAYAFGDSVATYVRRKGLSMVQPKDYVVIAAGKHDQVKIAGIVYSKPEYYNADQEHIELFECYGITKGATCALEELFLQRQNQNVVAFRVAWLTDDTSKIEGWYNYIGFSSVKGEPTQKNICDFIELRSKEMLATSVDSSESCKITLCETNLSDDRQLVTIQTVTLKELMEDSGLIIPPYQREYCWRRRQVGALLDSLLCWWRYKEKKFHLGTIILKAQSNNTSSRVAIIDGQQRILTLAIVLFALKNELPFLLEQDDGRSPNMTASARKYLCWAKRTIDERLNRLTNVTEKSNFCSWLNNNVQFSAVILDKNLSEDVAYTFFNAANSTGKPLSDYDLLKTHHLRHIKEEMVAQCAAQYWDSMGSIQAPLINTILYRIRNWSNGNTFCHTDADKSDKHWVFHHFSVETDIIPLLANASPLQIDSLFSGGADFFSYISCYHQKYLQFQALPLVADASYLPLLSGHSNSILYEGIKAALFLYFARFGEAYLADALFCITYKISRIRNEQQVRRSYLADRRVPDIYDCVSILGRMTSPAQFFAWALDPRSRYSKENQGPTAKSYWDAVDYLFENLREKMIIDQV